MPPTWLHTLALIAGGALLAPAPIAAQPAAPAPAPATVEAVKTVEIDRCVTPPGLDPRQAENQAADHYDRGTRLYEQGDYEAAIEEFVSAYCRKPFYRVLKDIAQSFERMVNYEKAVAYLRRYVRETPPEEVEERRVQSARIAVLERLPARIRVATAPEGAEVVLRDEHGVRARAISDGSAPMAIPKGRYLMVVTHDGYQTIERPIEVEIGQPYSYYFQLDPQRGRLRVITVPASARIFVDKRWVAIGNYVDDLALGNYVVETEADGYLSARREIAVTDTQGVNLTIELAPEPRSGRLELVAAAAAGGALVGGAVTATASDNEPIRSIAGAGVGLAAGLAGAYLSVPHDWPLSDSSYVIGLSTISSLEIGLLGSFIARGLDSCSDSSSCVRQVGLASAVGAGLTGAVTGVLTASRADIDDGDMSLVNSGAMWGAVTGAIFWQVFNSERRLLEPLGLSGLNMGLLAGILIAQRVDYSRRHVVLIDLGGASGLVIGAALGTLVSASDDSANEQRGNFALAGMALGLITSTYLTRNFDEVSPLPALSPAVNTAAGSDGQHTLTVGVHGRF
ncbi:MAG: hypothetical protein Tsb0020_38940 [Haliangiales bacterium]